MINNAGTVWICILDELCLCSYMDYTDYFTFHKLYAQDFNIYDYHKKKKQHLRIKYNNYLGRVRNAIVKCSCYVCVRGRKHIWLVGALCKQTHSTQPHAEDANSDTVCTFFMAWICGILQTDGV